ncbi:heterokaryon incompatibility protein-domain-containing protein [Hypomontagnella submonticulosa]|nr:heterokaryon incompatibility protein-domain-containing protein [Hypomontagnella submonticulosa]
MLCQACQVAFQAAYYKAAGREPPSVQRNYATSFKALICSASSATRTYSTVQSLHTSLLTGCPTCRRIWIFFLEFFYDTESEPVQKAAEGDVPETYEEFCAQDGIGTDVEAVTFFTFKITSRYYYGRPYHCSFDITTNSTKSCRFYLFPTSDIPELVPSWRSWSVSTADKPELWRHWLRTCLESHKKCQDAALRPAFIPKRLIEISSDNSCFKWRLIYPTSDTVQYLTLSHCWGSSEHRKLTKETHSAFLEFSGDSELPKTYRDAFRITASLDFKFIWIDSLCIIQDDTGDWEEQSSLMGSVYGGARCNIAAAWAKDGDGGCFSRRDPFLVGSQMTLVLRDGSVTNFDILFAHLSQDNSPKGPLHSRAWVVQERYLATRQLVFSKHQMFWECLQPKDFTQFLECSQPYSNYFLWKPPGWQYSDFSFAREKPILEYHDENAFRETWAQLVEYYSGCGITKASDRLIALAGLAARSREAAQGEYLAGLWEKNLQAQLCWAVDEFRSKSPRRISSGVAPTWSWANIGAPIRWDMIHVRDLPPTALAEVVRASVNADDPTNVSGELVVKGITMRARRTFRVESAFIVVDPLEPTNLPWTPITDIRPKWDEYISDEDGDSSLRERLQMEREGDILLIQTSYMRMGSFRAHAQCGSIMLELAKRLGLPDTHDETRWSSTPRAVPPELMTVNLDDPGLADLVQEVTII